MTLSAAKTRNVSKGESQEALSSKSNNLQGNPSHALRNDSADLQKSLDTFVVIFRDTVEKALKSAIKSDLTEAYFLPVIRKLDDHLVRIELWGSDIELEDPGLRRLVSDKITKNYIADTIDDITSQLENVTLELSLYMESHLDHMSAIRFDKL